MTRRGDGALRKLEKAARRILRSLKVGVMPDLMRDVLRTESRSSAREVATAYLIALARRHAAEQLSNPHLEPRTRRWLARRVVNHQRRLDGLASLPDVFGHETVPVLPPIPATPAALPPARGLFDNADEDSP